MHPDDPADEYLTNISSDAVVIFHALTAMGFS